MCDAFKAGRELIKDPIVEKRAPELKTKVSEAFERCKRVKDLPACVDDIKRKLDFAVEELGVKSENVILLVNEDVFY